MSSPLPKRLIEVDLPIQRISAQARREKSIRYGHISTLHIWWARRPLAACRAVICASLWPDPADKFCPDAFREAARRWMEKWAKNHVKLLGRESGERFLSYQSDLAKLGDNKELRCALLDFIAEFANWDNSAAIEYLETSRALTQTAHESMGGVAGTKPLVVDPFCGGGSIPLEALRVGADTFASDLNPVAVLINRLALEYIPKYGSQLAPDVRRWAQWIKKSAEKELACFYPKDPSGATPIAYLWARTVRCEGPRCGAEIPLIRSLWLSKKSNRSVALQLVPNIKAKRLDFRVLVKRQDGWVDQAAPEKPIKSPNFDGTVRRGSATCLCCNFTTPVSRVREQLRARKGGSDDARLFCVVTTRAGESGRFYRVPESSDFDALRNAGEELSKRLSDYKGSIGLLPHEPIPAKGTLGFRIQNYGMSKWSDVFAPRQALTLVVLSELVARLGEEVRKEHSPDASCFIQSILSLSLNRLIGRINSLCWWRSDAAHETIELSFSGQTVPMKWDFAEACPLTDGTAGWEDSYTPPIRVIETLASLNLESGAVAQADATTHPLPDDSAQAFITDPPYYDAVPYAALSDFYYVWMKRTMPSEFAGLFANEVSPKDGECIVDPASGKDRVYFERCMGKAMAEGRRLLCPSGIGVLVFAHKSTSGWEAQLQAMIDAGWIVTGSWPIDTEMGSRLRARDSAALASSVHLVCRPREGSTQTHDVGDWRDVLQELPVRIHEWMPRLAAEGVVGADAIFACLGPALEVFSRYSRVEKASGEPITLKEYLEYVWAAIAKEALTMVFKSADASGFEEDARLTAMWLWTLSAGRDEKDEAEGDAVEDEEESETVATSPRGYVLEFDAARKIAQGLGAHLESLISLVEVKGEVARLLPVAERTRKLFGKDEAETPTKLRKKKTAQLQLGFLAEVEEAEEAGSWGSKGAPAQGATVLDRVHQSMILFAAGRSEALRRFLVDEGVGRDERFWRLAQVLSYLYPKASDEKRWIDGVLARKKGLGF